MAFVAYTSSPFVIYAHLRLPAFARRSQEMLFRFSQRIPKDTELDLTTMSFFGRPRVTRLKIGDLKESRGRLGVANLARKAPPLNPGRSWLARKPLTEFFVSKAGGRKRLDGVWRSVLENIGTHE